MKILNIVGASLVLTAMGVIICREGRLRRDLTILQSKNQLLVEKVAQLGSVSPEEVARKQSQLENIQNALNDVQRLLVQKTIQSEAGPERGPSSDPNNGFQRETALPGNLVDAAAGPVSSSHSKDGQLLQRPWGPEQLVGPPNTHEGGDLPTAWAPRESTGTSEEWVHVNYARAVELAEVRVRETYNPGAISKVAAVLPSGREVVLWQGVEPAADAPVDTAFLLPPGVTAQSVKIYLDRTRASGWNEIDAVELVGKDGSRQWASSAATSSSYAERPAENSQPLAEFLSGANW